ncbi:MAG: hypothetical protein WDA74_11370 [Spirochaetota bacterium]
MEIFDGFISAIASELKIPFHKDDEGQYTATVEFDNDRSQEIMVTLRRDESGDRVINYHSEILDIKTDMPDLYKYCLILNNTFDYGALALRDQTLVMYNSILLDELDPVRFIKSLIYIAAKADELEEMLLKEDTR